MLIRQKEGVEYAINCAGPAYHAINDVTYTSEHKQFASFLGSDGKTFYGMYVLMRLIGPDHAKTSYVICEQQRCRSASASSQSDQHLCCSLFG